jgi:RimJ/RimL family protein N-acetyltransferase
MHRGDIQVGDIWTADAYRGRGLAAFVLREIISEIPGRPVWFLCESSNEASARLAKSAGMSLYGVGERKPRFGISLLGQFQIDSVVSN